MCARAHASVCECVCVRVCVRARALGAASSSRTGTCAHTRVCARAHAHMCAHDHTATTRAQTRACACSRVSAHVQPHPMHATTHSPPLPRHGTVSGGAPPGMATPPCGCDGARARTLQTPEWRPATSPAAGQLTHLDGPAGPHTSHNTTSMRPVVGAYHLMFVASPRWGRTLLTTDSGRAPPHTCQLRRRPHPRDRDD